jgi:hypothetical protein
MAQSAMWNLVAMPEIELSKQISAKGPSKIICSGVKEMLLFSGNHDTDKKSRFPFA